MPVDQKTLVNLTADIVAAHLSNNHVSVDKVAGLIGKIFGSLADLGVEPLPLVEKRKGAVSARASIRPDHLISMIDGKPYKTLKRHIALRGYSPESYRETFGLPASYPMVATGYAKMKSKLARASGLGHNAPLPPPPAKRSRPRKAALAAST